MPEKRGDTTILGRPPLGHQIVEGALLADYHVASKASPDIRGFTVKVAVVGAGAVGGWIGGRMTEGGSQSTIVVDALHVSKAQALRKTPVDIAFICTKRYDTDWATALGRITPRIDWARGARRVKGTRRQ